VPAAGEVDSFSKSQLGTAAVRRLKVVPDGRKTPQAPPVDFLFFFTTFSKRFLQFLCDDQVYIFLKQC
jgi:hypothetical protein